LTTDHLKRITHAIAIPVCKAVARAVVATYGVCASASVGGFGVVVARCRVLATDHLERITYIIAIPVCKAIASTVISA
jgi:hypothetical protein